MTWTALVLAGSRGGEDPVARAAGVPHKAMATVAGRRMIDHVIDALNASQQVGQIVICGPEDLPLPPGTSLLPTASTPASSVLAALEDLGTPLLITTADNPLLSAKTLTMFLDQAGQSNADAVAAVAPREVAEQAGNPGRRTYLKFRDTAVSGCNLFAILTPAGRAAPAFWRRLEVQRKKPWRMALSIGPWALIQYALGRLTLDAAAKAIAAKAGCRAAIIRLTDPYAPHDVDKPEDLVFVEQILSRSTPDEHGKGGA